MLMRTAGKTYDVEDGRSLDGAFGNGAPVLLTGSERLCKQLAEAVFKGLGLCATPRYHKDENCPYALVLWGRDGRSAPRPQDVKAARLMGLCLARGVNDAHLYGLD